MTHRLQDVARVHAAPSGVMGVEFRQVRPGPRPLQQDSEGAYALLVDPGVEDVSGHVEGMPIGSGEGSPAVPEDHDTRGVSGLDVIESVRKSVETVVGEILDSEGALTGLQKLCLALDLPRVETDVPPARTLGGMSDHLWVGGRGPVVDAGVGVPRQQLRQTAHPITLSQAANTGIGRHVSR